MEINTSQVGQNFASSRVGPTSDSEAASSVKVDEVQNNLAQAKGFSISAETETQEIEISDSAVESAVSQINEFVQSSSRQLNFSIDDASNKQVVRVTDSESGEIIRQIPSAEVLKLSERLQELQTDVGTAVGLLFNKQV